MKPFSVRNIAPGVFTVLVPAPAGALYATNCTVVVDEDEALVVDPGGKTPDSSLRMQDVLHELTRGRKLSYAVTHTHIDHSGMVDELASPDSAVYVSQAEMEAYNHEALVRMVPRLKAKLQSEGTSSQFVDLAVQGEVGNTYILPQRGDIRVLTDGDKVTVGRRTFYALSTPGHCVGHMCYYDPEHELLLSGDHVLFVTAPVITRAFDVGFDPLGDYLRSLEKVASLEVRDVVPGHGTREPGIGGSPQTYPQRVAWLRDHQLQRVEETRRIIAARPGITGYQVAQSIEWNNRASTWEATPWLLRYSMIDSALSFLDHLVAEGAVVREGGPESAWGYYPA